MTALRLISLLTTFSLAACATNPELPHFGESVRVMIQQQTANPETIASPDEEPVEGLPGKRSEQIVREHDQNVTRPEENSNVINVSIGGN